MGDDGVETRLPAVATLLPPIGRDAHSNSVLQQWATRVSLQDNAGDSRQLYSKQGIVDKSPHSRGVVDLYTSDSKGVTCGTVKSQSCIIFCVCIGGVALCSGPNGTFYKLVSKLTSQVS